MILFQDQLNRPIHINFPPKRIISTVPSQTELLYDLGLRDEVIGITKFCIHPEKWFRTKQRIGGTKQLKLELIESLEPDLIIANKEENDKEQIEYLAAKFPVWLSDITTFDSAMAMIQQVGNLIHKPIEADNLVAEIQRQKSKYNKPTRLQKVAYFIWRKPYMIAANNTYINEMLRLYGAINVFEHLKRYPEIDLNDLKLMEIDVIFLSSEPYPFKDKHLEEFKTVCPKASIVLVDGELFSWYGSRMLKAFPYFEQLSNKTL
ncbi:MAG: ABC transporter substrate-binding protein [Saprospiraceae bacterium]